jgi:hypothetical protein
MMRLMIRAEIAGVVSCPLIQSIDMLAFRSRLRTLMDWTDHPQTLTPRTPVEVLANSSF